ncbi:MAG: HAMP domain-containing histidine kinase [Clostridiales Family XIII bacterium]|jgi:signal transduction histidine kinase|nr:HAMP domain-containing histidine kinase [Clostridiales Family XIII bacterium]
MLNFLSEYLARAISQIFYTKIISDGKYLAVIRSQVTPVDSTTQVLKWILIFISIFILLFVILLSYFMARGIVNPIIKIKRYAEQISLGNFNTDFKIKGDYEIKELSKSLSNMSKELSKLEKLRDEFIANVSHDLRTPLTMIMGYAEVIRDIPGENTKENLNVIIEEAERLSLMVSDLLELMRIKNDKDALQKEKFNLTASIRKMIKNANELNKGSKNAEYKILLKTELDAFVFADKGKIERAFYNLLINALKHIGDDKLVEVIQTTNEGKVKIQVKDKGKGIKKEELPYIFNRYKTDRNDAEGLGIGLAVVEGIMKAHGFHYGVKSEFGKGSDFYFEIPLI